VDFLLFLVAKIAVFLTKPLHLIWFALITQAVLLKRGHLRAALILNISSVIAMSLMGLLPISEFFLQRLENRAIPIKQQNQVDFKTMQGVIVLGGAFDPAYVWQGHRQPALNEAAERMTAALPLLQQAPGLRLLFTGGDGELIPGKLTEAERAARFYTLMGVVPERLLMESASRTTYENAVFSARLTGVDTQKPWLLLTSAWHMPRAMASDAG
jgi:uncharacterized SAM-binding protein YcdF (DUF218 family)